MAELSPAAQAVLDAFTADNYGVYLEGDPERIAAALRAAADQVVPDEVPPCGGMRPGGTGAVTLDEAQQFQRAATRRKLRAIAAELNSDPHG